MIALGRSHETSIIREGENLNIEDYGFAPNAWHSENGGFPVKGAGPLDRRCCPPFATAKQYYAAGLSLFPVPTPQTLKSTMAAPRN